MAFDFPASPTEGQIYNAPGGPTYVFNSPVWKAVGQGQIAIISDTAPSNPANGQLWWESDTGTLFLWYTDPNSSQWVQVGGVTAGGAQTVTVLTTSGTYTKPAGLQYLDVQGVGPGGAGGGAGSTLANQVAAGGGGGAGGYARILLKAADVPATVAMTIGAVGAPLTGNVAGGNGGISSFGSILTLTGGAGGLSAPATGATTYANGGTGGTVSGGTLNVTGNPGFPSLMIASIVSSIGGNGGSSYYGGSGRGNNNADGMAGTAYGSGGSGASRGQSSGQGTSGAGGASIFILTEFY